MNSTSKGGKVKIPIKAWADYLHLDNGRMVAVVEGFRTLQQAIDYVDFVEKHRPLPKRVTKAEEVRCAKRYDRDNLTGSIYNPDLLPKRGKR